MSNFGVEDDHVLEAAVNGFIERQKLIRSNRAILIVILLGDGSLVAAYKVTCLLCCYFHFGSIYIVPFDYPASSTLEMHLPAVILDCCILSKDEFYAVIAILELLYWVVTSYFQGYMNNQCFHFSKTNIYDMCVGLLKSISGSNYLETPTLD
ncbi:hypothetical protein TSUD_296960 [Trifolium subterraneum]|uniref:Uncharacterized protein n=1 Tax=Trifolium subterraneum TaxID=3900 RepID=A0A2Z6NAY2_TRISU|nr:hypothetical protein TSUD_296960 [Trifolium subterraneum]